MSAGKIVRTTHKWVSVVFLLIVAVVTVGNIMGNAPLWLNYVPLPPLFALMLSGLYMLTAPLFARRRKQN